jgi:hypothetical protein
VETRAAAVDWGWVEARLRERLDAIEEEIRGYPMPIPACDAQYNHLLEQRTALALEIGRAREAARGTGPDPDAFLAGCPYLEQPAGL